MNITMNEARDRERDREREKDLYIFIPRDG